jgi:hypothetical protein
MSDTALKEIIDRAVNDEAYRKLLLNDPDKALEGYKLSNENRKILEGLTEDTFDEFAGGLGDRTTKGWITSGG